MKSSRGNTNLREQAGNKLHQLDKVRAKVFIVIYSNITIKTNIKVNIGSRIRRGMRIQLKRHPIRQELKKEKV